MSNTPNMGIPLDIPGSTPGPVSGVFGGVNQWATDNESFKTLVDAHDHSSGKGVQVQPAGLNISSDLSFQGNNATNLRTSRYSVQGSQPSGASDRAISYAGTNGELYWINSANQVVQITSGGSINVSSAGGITGLAGTNAAVTWSPALNTFIFTQAPTQPAALSGGSYSFAQNGAVNPNSITLQSPNSLASAYSITLPAAQSSAPSGTTALLTLTSAGVMGDSLTPTIAGGLTIAGNNQVAFGLLAVSGYMTASGLNLPPINGANIAPSTQPATGDLIVYQESTNGLLMTRGNAGALNPISPIVSKNTMVAQAGFTVSNTVETIVCGGPNNGTNAPTKPFFIPVGSGGTAGNSPGPGSIFRFTVWGSFTSSATGTTTVNMRQGTTGTVSDTQIWTHALSTTSTSSAIVGFRLIAEVCVLSADGALGIVWGQQNSANGIFGAQSTFNQGTPDVGSNALNFTVGNFYELTLKTSASSSVITINGGYAELL